MIATMRASGRQRLTRTSHLAGFVPLRPVRSSYGGREVLSEKAFRDWPAKMAAETWYSAKEAKAAGLADDVEEQEEEAEEDWEKSKDDGRSSYCPRKILTKVPDCSWEGLSASRSNEKSRASPLSCLTLAIASNVREIVWSCPAHFLMSTKQSFPNYESSSLGPAAPSSPPPPSQENTPSKWFKDHLQEDFLPHPSSSL